MISGFRKSLRSWATVMLLLIALVAIVVTGFGTDGMGGMGSLGGGSSSQTLATVNGTEITESEISDLVGRAFAGARAGQPDLTMAAFIGAGGFNEILYQTIIARAVRDFAEDRGLIVSRRMIDREIVGVPAFRDLSGQFSEGAYRATLARENVTESRFRDDVFRVLIQRQLMGPVGLSSRVPEGVARAYANIQLERRRGLLATIPVTALTAGIEPTDAQLAQFYQANRRGFTVPERRVIKYAVIDAGGVRQPVTATEAEIAAAYRANAPQYAARESRTVQAIVLPTQAAARAFAQRVRGGTDFVAAAAEAGFAAGDVTFAERSREQFATATTPEIAAAAFGAAQGAVVGPIRSELGFHVARVERIVATPARPLESVRADLVRAIETRKRGEALAALVASVEEQLSQGASFDDAARAAGLTVLTTPPITAQGRTASGPPFAVPAELRPLLQTAFDIDPEDPEPVIEQIEPNVRYALVGVDRVEPAAPPPLAQIRDRVRTAYIRRTALQRARELAERAAQRINAGMPPAQAFAEAQPRISAQPLDMRRLEINRVGLNPPAQLAALFGLRQGRARAIPMTNNEGWYVVVHLERTAGSAANNPELVTDTRTQFNQGASEEIAQQFARSIELRAAINRDEPAIARARRQALGVVSGE